MLRGIKTSCYEPLYRHTDAEMIRDMQRARRERHKIVLRTCIIRRRLGGIILIVIGCLIRMIDNESGMAAIACVVVGIGLVVQR